MCRLICCAALMVLTTMNGAAAPSEGTEPSADTWCLRILDSGTGAPVEGVRANHYLVEVGDAAHPGGRVISRTWVSDDRGMCCLELSGDDSCWIHVTGNGYLERTVEIDPGGEPGVQDVALTPLAYLRVRLKNVAPQDPEDVIAIHYPGAAMGTTFFRFGSQVDTVSVDALDPAAREIVWSSEHLGLASAGSLTGFSLNPGDTLDLKIEY